MVYLKCETITYNRIVLLQTPRLGGLKGPLKVDRYCFAHIDITFQPRQMRSFFISMDENLTVNRKCFHCTWITEWKLARTITTSGISQVYWICTECDRRPYEKKKDIKHKDLRQKGIHIDRIEIRHNYTGQHFCAVCRAPGVENHHWAPRYLFGWDCVDWPQDWLCEFHHRQWHDLVTPNMCEVKDGKR